MADFLSNLIRIANDDLHDMPLRAARNYRDEIIEKIFWKLSMSEKFTLACVLERAHLTRLVEAKCPGQYSEDDMPIFIDQMVRRMREREALSGVPRQMPFSSNGGVGHDPDYH